MINADPVTDLSVMRSGVTAGRRPFDPAAFAAEPSPVADIGLDEAADLPIAQLKQAGAGRPVSVVAHSMGGAVLTRATQPEPELVAHMVYIAESTELTDRWGSVPRTYVMCSQDRTIPAALQQLFITQADAAFPANPTEVVKLDTSHSAFLSAPAEVAEIIATLP